MNLVSALQATAASRRTAMIFLQPAGAEERYTYAELYEASLRVLGALQARGLKEGDELVLQCEDNKTFLIVFWACVLGRIVPVPLSGGVQAEQKHKFFQVWAYLSQPWLFCDEPQWARLSALADEDRDLSAIQEQMAGRYLGGDSIFRHSAPGTAAAIRPDDLAYIQFSSGSTGDPKGVCLTHANLMANTADIARSLHIRRDDVLLNWMPLTHDMGMIGFHLLGVCFDLGAVSMATPVFIRRPLLWMEQASTHRASVLYAPNFGLQYFLNAFEKKAAPGWDLSCVRILVNGAEAISVPLCERFLEVLAPFGWPSHSIVAAYGLAEASVEVAASEPGTPIRSHELDRRRLNIGDVVSPVVPDAPEAVSFAEVGRVVDSCQLRICGDDDAELPGDTIGHIQIRGRNVTTGYYHNDKATQELFTPDGWLRTGDLGFLHEEGLVVTGRYKNIIIVNGQNYYPQDIERAIIHEGLAEQGKVVACGLRKGQSAERLIVFVWHKGSAEAFAPQAAAIRDAVLSRIGLGAEVVPVARIPKTTSGKVRHFQLLEEYAATKTGAEPAAAPNFTNDPAATSAWLINEVSAVLGVPARIDSDLLALGLNSLAAMQLCDRITRHTGRTIGVEALFTHTRIEDLIRHIDETPALSSLPPVVATAPAVRYPLSFAQRRIFGEYLVQPESTAYHLLVIHTIKGRFDAAALDKALAHIVGQYEILRTSFERAGEGFVQAVHDTRPEFSAVSHIDLRIQPDRRNEAERLTTEEITKPFNLEQPAAFRTTLIQLADDEYRLVFVAHHILLDGRSLEIVFHRLFDACTSLDNNTAPAFQYRDYVAWQEALTRSEAYRQDRAYWLDTLRDLPAPVDLSVLPPSTGFVVDAAVHRCTFDAGLSKQLAGLAQRYHASPFTVLLALLNTLVHRYTGLFDLSIGFDTTGRISRELEDIVGYTLQTLCLRTRLQPQESFRELMMQVRQKSLEAQDHQLYPFEHLTEDLRKGQQGNPLFNILVLFQNFYQRELRLQGCALHRETAAVPHGFTDMVFEFEQQGNGLKLLVQYDRHRYTQVEVERLTLHLQLLIAAVHYNDTKPLSRYDFLSLPEKRKLLRSAQMPGTGNALRQPVHILFERQAARMPQAVAVRAGKRVLTYERLNYRANRLAHWLRGRGAACDERIGFLVGRTEQLVVVLMGILKSGAAYVALDPEWPAARWQQVVRDSGMTCLLTDEKHSKAARAALPGTPVEILEESGAGNGNVNPAWSRDLHSLAYVIYTSGSTGVPKGVLVEQATLTAYVQQFTHYFNVSSADVFIQQASVAFDTLCEEVYPVLCSAGSLVIAPGGGRDTDALIRLIHAHQATVLSTTPLVLQELNSQADKRLDSLRLVISGGDVLQPFHIDKLCGRMPVYNTYGPSEATVCATYHRVASAEDAGTIGRPIRGRSVYILDAQSELLPIGRVGEICIEGGLARGYLNEPGLTAEKFTAPAFDPTKRIYRTGDLGRWTEDGNLLFLGRNDQQLKLRGHRTEPAEIERAIGQYAGIVQCAVVAAPATQDLYAFVVAKAGYDEQTLRIFLGEQLPYYMVPRHFMVVDRLPQSTAGKIDRQALAARINTGERQTVFRAPAGKLQEALAAIAGEVLKIDRLGADDDFFALGADSIKAVRMQGAVLQSMGCQISLRDVFLFPTVSMLANRMESLPAAKPVDIKPAPPAESYELTPAQKRLWLLCTLNKGTRAYNEGTLVSIEGPLDPVRAGQVCKSIVRDHEVLRTVFIQVDGEPRQVVQPAVDHVLNFRYVDRSNPADALTLADATISAPYDLQNGPLYRIVLARTAEDRHVFTLAMHHIITDDWSAALILRAFESAYSATGDNPVMPAISYKDYAHWLQQSGPGPDAQDHRAYWQEQFRAAPPPLDLSPDFPRPAVKQDEGALVYADINPELYASLRNTCRTEGVSLFMLLLSAVGSLLHRYSGQNDLVIGTPVADRAHPALKDLPGFLINTLPLRLNIDEGDTVEILVQKIKAVCLDAFAHQSYPLELLLDELPATRDLSRSPLFDVVVNLSSAAPLLSGLEGLRSTPLRKQSAGSKYDLEFYFEEGDAGLRLLLVYDRHLFRADRMERMVGHLLRLLQLFVEERTGLIGRLDYLPKEEQQELFHDFNRTILEVPRQTALALFEEQVRLHPDSVAVRCQERSFSYGEIDRRAGFLATRLCKYFGLRPQSFVGLLLERNEQVIISILGIWKGGAAYVPIDPSLPEERIRQLVVQSGVTLVVTDEAHLSLCEKVVAPTVARTVCISQGVADGNVFGNDVRTRMEDVAYMLFTSGSTGVPKGVPVPHRALTNLLWSLRHGLGLEADGAMLSVSSYTFDISLSEFFLPLTFGGTVILATTEEVLNLRQLHRLLLQSKPDLMQGTPGLWQALVETGWEGSSSLTAITCGEPLRPHLRTQLLSRTGRLWNLYGPTETTIFSSGTLITSDEGPVTIGSPLGNTCCFILDRQGQPVPAGVQGQLYIGGRGLSLGYWQQAELTAEKFREGWPFYSGRLYATGDIARWLPDGNIEYLGRADDQVKIRGFRIEPGEIETALLQCPGVQSAVVLVQRSADDAALAAFVTGTGISTGVLGAWLRGRLPAYMVPAQFVIAERIPLTVNGKVDKPRLLALLNAEPRPPVENALPSTRMEKLLADIWHEVLGRNGFGIDDSFFDLGGHSLKANQLVNKIYSGLGVEVSLSDIFTHATIRQLGAHIDALEAAEYDFVALA